MVSKEAWDPPLLLSMRRAPPLNWKSYLGVTACNDCRMSQPHHKPSKMPSVSTAAQLHSLQHSHRRSLQCHLNPKEWQCYMVPQWALFHECHQWGCAELNTLYKNIHVARTLRPKSLRDFEASLWSLSISLYFIATINSTTWVGDWNTYNSESKASVQLQ